MANKYIAVTIGPIFDTINLASSPSALWAASYLFSALSKNICRALTKDGVKKEDIISPYYDPEDELLNKNDGVGLFHDRIIFRAGKYSLKKFSSVKEKAIKDTLALFQFKEEDTAYFKKYFLISAFAYESDSPILDSSKPLDCLELAKPFAEERGSNPLLTMYNSDNPEEDNKGKKEKKKSKNEAIKNRVEKIGINSWQLFDSNHTVMSLPQIAKNRVPSAKAGEFKKFKYYAVIRSDGDRMGKIIEKLRDVDDPELKDYTAVRTFSHNCLKYCSDIAEKVKRYGGVTIYSGGDDLLALVPVENGCAETVFDFIKSANEIFKKSFEKYSAEVSLSFGVFVSYIKFPLYEALEESAGLLFRNAKKFRNCSAVHFQKNAGQSEGLVIFNDSLDGFIELYDRITGRDEANKDNGEDNRKDRSDIILSAMHKLSQFDLMFNNAGTDEEIRNLFDNTFDADAHKGNAFLKDTLPGFFIDLKNKLRIYPITNQNPDKNDKTYHASKRYILSKDEDLVLAMNYILRVIKFFTERGGEK